MEKKHALLSPFPWNFPLPRRLRPSAFAEREARVRSRSLPRDYLHRSSRSSALYIDCRLGVARDTGSTCSRPFSTLSSLPTLSTDGARGNGLLPPPAASSAATSVPPITLYSRRWMALALPFESSERRRQGWGRELANAATEQTGPPTDDACECTYVRVSRCTCVCEHAYRRNIDGRLGLRATVILRREPRAWSGC